MSTHYETLRVTADATDAEIKKAYRRLALEFHPDKNPSGDEIFKKIGAAYETLGDTEQRRKYDISLRESSQDKHDTSAKSTASSRSHREPQPTTSDFTENRSDWNISDWIEKCREDPIIIKSAKQDFTFLEPIAKEVPAILKFITLGLSDMRSLCLFTCLHDPSAIRDVPEAFISNIIAKAPKTLQYYRKAQTDSSMVIAACQTDPSSIKYADESILLAVIKIVPEALPFSSKVNDRNFILDACKINSSVIKFVHENLVADIVSNSPTTLQFCSVAMTIAACTKSPRLIEYANKALIVDIIAAVPAERARGNETNYVVS